MMKRVMAATASLALLTTFGCGQQVTQEDVNSARQEVLEERQETERTRQTARREIAEEEAETAAVRQEVMRPDFDRIREEEKETELARQEALEAIREEQGETGEAAERLDELQRKQRAEVERATFLERAEETLKEGESRIDAYRQKATSLEGPEEIEARKQIQEMLTRHDRLEEAIRSMRAAEVERWNEFRDQVTRAMDDLAQEVEESR